MAKKKTRRHNLSHEQKNQLRGYLGQQLPKNPGWSVGDAARNATEDLGFYVSDYHVRGMYSMMPHAEVEYLWPRGGKGKRRPKRRTGEKRAAPAKPAKRPMSLWETLENRVDQLLDDEFDLNVVVSVLDEFLKRLGYQPENPEWAEVVARREGRRVGR